MRLQTFVCTSMAAVLCLAHPAGASTFSCGTGDTGCLIAAIYVLGTDNNWWRWTGTGWVLFRAVDPSQ